MPGTEVVPREIDSLVLDRDERVFSIAPHYDNKNLECILKDFQANGEY